MKNTLVFIHGLESTAQGTKAQYFRKLFPQMMIGLALFEWAIRELDV